MVTKTKQTIKWKVFDVTVCLWFCLLLNSCDTDNPVGNNQRLELLPLKVGNSWTMQRTRFTRVGNLHDIDTITITVDADTIIDGQTWFVTTSGIFRNSNNGLWRYLGAPLLQYKYPGQVADTFAVARDTVVIESINEMKSTPTSSFYCYHYVIHVSNSEGLMLHSYYSPGIGSISLEQASRGQDGWKLDSRLQLLSFTVQ